MIQIQWRCTECQEFIADDDGYLAVGPDVLGGMWEPWHLGCDPDPESNGYAVGVEALRTYADLLRWTAHLVDKDWLKNTSWLDLIKEITQTPKPRSGGAFAFKETK